jgi:hypothetical protein
MTTRAAFPLKGHINPNVIRFSGRVAMNQGNAPTVTAGRGVTAACGGTGQLVLTLPISFQTLVGYGFTQAQATIADTYQKVTAWSATNRTITLYNYAGGGTTVTAWQAAATYNEISFWVEVQTDSSTAT